MSGALPSGIQMVEFLKKFKILECNVCSIPIGAVNRTTGVLVCLGSSNCTGECLQQSTAGDYNLPTSAAILPAGGLVGGRSVVEITKPLELAVGTGTSSGNVEAGLSVTTKPSGLVKLETPSGSGSTKTNANQKPVSKQHSVKATKEDAVDAKVAKPAPPSEAPVKSSMEVTDEKKNKPILWTDTHFSDNLKTGAPIHVMFAWNASTFQVSADKDVEALDKFQEQLQGMVARKQLKPLTGSPVPDQMVVALYDGGYYRGRVKSIQGLECEVEFVDYGDSAAFAFTDVFEVPLEMLQAPVYGMKLCLTDASPVSSKPASDLPEDVATGLYEEGFTLELVDKVIITKAGSPEFKGILRGRDNLSLGKKIMDGIIA